MKLSATFLIFSIFLCSVWTSNSPVRYDGHQVLRTYPADPDQVKLLAVLEGKYDFWTSPRLGGPTDIRVGGYNLELVKNYFRENQIPFEIFIDDVQKSIERGKSPQITPISGRINPENFDLSKYHTYEEIYDWLDHLAAKHNSCVQLNKLETSHDGRPIKALLLSSQPLSMERKTIVIDAGTHAREWISIAVILCFINSLLSQGCPSFLTMGVDIYAIPIVNPDGYVFSYTKDRMWRKNRFPGKNCNGVDINRNFGHKFGGEGTSENECYDIYCGTAAFSEPESRAVRNLTEFCWDSKGKWPDRYMALHSYGQYILYPWGWGSGWDCYDSDNKVNMDKTASIMADVFTAHGRTYQFGTCCKLFYPAAGASDDWNHFIGVPQAFTLELPDAGEYGFLLPPEKIFDVCTETVEAFRAFVQDCA